MYEEPTKQPTKKLRTAQWEMERVMSNIKKKKKNQDKAPSSEIRKRAKINGIIEYILNKNGNRLDM